MVPPPATPRYRSKPCFTSFAQTSTFTAAKTSEPVSPTNSQKRVCFADSIGLSLASIRFISPCKSDKNLKLLRRQRHRCTSSRNVFVPQTNTSVRYLSCDFAQPIDTTVDFEDRLNAQRVCLERVLCSNSALVGTVKVRNLAFEKKVTVRVTFDHWKTHRDIWADYVSTCPDNEADKFIFRITLPSCFAEGQKIEFAIRYIVGGKEFWDNNSAKNYSVSCLKVETTDYDTISEFDKLPALVELWTPQLCVTWIKHYVNLTLSLPRVIHFKFLLQPHQKYYITRYEEFGFL